MTRLDRLRQRLGEEELDALVVLGAANIKYLTGFVGAFDSSFGGFLFVAADRAAIITDFRYEQQLSDCARGTGIEIASTAGDYAQRLARLAATDPGRTAVEDSVSVATKARMDGAFGGSLGVASGLVESLRAVKDTREIDAIARSARLTDDAFEHVLPSLRVGASTRDVALELEWYMRTQGATAAAFNLIVASGSRSSMPHATTTDQTIARGDFVKIDIGAVVDDYCSDMTRTVVAGEAGMEHRRVYDAVLEAQERALAGVRAGMSGMEADGLARDFLVERGFGENFGHGLGHGVGLEVHERPRLARTSTDVVEAGMVVTVEPGVYLPGFGGVRIEDLVVVEDGGIRNLTSTPKELLVV